MHRKAARQTRGDKFEIMAVRVAVFLDLAPPGSNHFADLPEKIKQHFLLMTYPELIRPLVHFDKTVRGWSVRRIAICYGVTYYQVITILSKCKC